MKTTTPLFLLLLVTGFAHAQQIETSAPRKPHTQDATVGYY